MWTALFRINVSGKEKKMLVLWFMTKAQVNLAPQDIKKMVIISQLANYCKQNV